MTLPADRKLDLNTLYFYDLTPVRVLRDPEVFDSWAFAHGLDDDDAKYIRDAFEVTT